MTTTDIEQALEAESEIFDSYTAGETRVVNIRIFSPSPLPKAVREDLARLRVAEDYELIDVDVDVGDSVTEETMRELFLQTGLNDVIDLADHSVMTAETEASYIENQAPDWLLQSFGVESIEITTFSMHISKDDLLT